MTPEDRESPTDPPGRSPTPGTRAGRLAIVIVLILVSVATLLVVREHRRGEEYRNALRLAQSGDTRSAYSILSGLGGYSDASERARELLEDDPALALRSAVKGDLVTFGSFEQDGDPANGPEPLRWIVLDRIEGRLLLLALDSIAARPYHPVPFQEVSWETSDLREWMNSDFLAAAFTGPQRALLVPGDAADDAGARQEEAPDEKAPSGDLVFALSRTEADVYLSDDVERELTGAARIAEAAKDPALPLDEDGRADWWLRSRGNYGFTAQFVDRSGAPYAPGANVDAVYAVRPALWLDPRRGGEER
ncbi:DUF6273 domain-containing protein [Schaalia hyovaginalis]|uniref:DUF6273 domain-containing protein n=1 Tax=Schaalia hyovaginalis TaxID=29316 RepID=UPI0026EE28CA|nr:DUF6273 domain-containing protein [Schaalia hyovaginalis]MDD7553909.1 DUF6273 domain-containing protein [Schaalia hyovaginalis]MDY3093348.1 DUF6273 domain-containing protein [Schaalia hyovaginalis]